MYPEHPSMYPHLQPSLYNGIFGDATDPAFPTDPGWTAPPASNPQTPAAGSSEWMTVYEVASFAGAALGAYHGYKRNNSVGWAFGWFIFGAVLPVLAIPVMFAEGFGKPER